MAYDLTLVPTAELVREFIHRSDDCILIQYRKMHNNDPQFRFWSTVDFPRVAFLCGYTHDFLLDALDEGIAPEDTEHPW